MFRMKLIKLLPAFGVAVLLLSGCGGKEGESSTESSLVIVNGAVEKGPFIIGSNVTVGKLNEAGQAIDSTLTTQTINDLGDFSFSYERDTLIQIKANGYYRNEITGELSTGTLTLRSIYVISSEEQQSAHINILTHLASNRVLELISKGSPATEAISTAEDELMVLLNAIVPGPSIDSFASLSLYNSTANKEGNAYLTLISSLFYQYSLILAGNNTTNPDAELTLVLNELANDFSDGDVEDASIFNDLHQTMTNIDPVSVQHHLNEFALLANSSSAPANINIFLDSDLDGLTNELDLDDDNDNIADEEDSSPYQKNFIVNDLNLQVLEDNNLPVVLDYSGPVGDNVNIHINKELQHGELTGAFPNFQYIPDLNFNGQDEVILYLSNGIIDSDFVTIKIDVVPVNDLPVIAGVPTTNLMSFDYYDFSPIIEDVDGDGIIYTIGNLPSWATFNESTGELKGSPDNTDIGAFENIIFSVSDGTEVVSIEPFTITVDAGPWQFLAQENGISASATHDDGIYVFNSNRSTAGNTWLFTPALNTYLAKAPIPSGLGYNIFASNIGGKIYVIGENSQNLYMYDPSLDLWSIKATPLFNRGNGNYIATELNGKLYLAGGFNSFNITVNKVEEYDPALDQWIEKSSSPVSVALAAGCTFDNKFYVIGGMDGISQDILSVSVYDPTTNKWSAGPDLPYPTTQTACSSDEDNLYLFGGKKNNSGQVDHVLSLTAGEYDWSSTLRMPTSNSWINAIVASHQNTIYLFSSKNREGDNAILVFDSSLLKNL